MSKTSCESLRPLSDHLSRAFVVAQPEKARLPQSSVARPFGKPDLSDETGPRPVRAAGNGSRVGECRLGRFELPQPVTEVPEHRLGVPGADLAGVAKGALLVVPDEQGAELLPATLGIGVSPADKLLLPDALQLQPVL